jgi:hypothetical protein
MEQLTAFSSGSRSASLRLPRATSPSSALLICKFKTTCFYPLDSGCEVDYMKYCVDAVDHIRTIQ